jgi:hypothetical protein
MENFRGNQTDTATRAALRDATRETRASDERRARGSITRRAFVARDVELGRARDERERIRASGERSNER